MLNTMPFTTPSDSALPIPSTSSLPNSFFRPAMAQILVVPISRPTTIFSCSMFAYCYSGCFGVFVLHKKLFVSRIALGHDLSFVFQIHAAVFIPSGPGQNFFIVNVQLRELPFEIFRPSKFDALITNLRVHADTAFVVDVELRDLRLPELIGLDVV